MPNTYTLLETISVGAAGAASVTFNSIPQTGYTDLVIKASCRSSQSGAFADYGQITFNGSSSTFSYKDVYGNGSSAASTGGSVNTSFVYQGNAATASTFGNAEIYIPNYTGSNNKSFSIDTVVENNGTTGYNTLTAGLWSTITAINSVGLAPASGTWLQHSTFSLYGVSALGTTPTKAPKATGGSIIQTDGTYWYHAFLSSGTFTPATALTCDVLVVAGGGGGAFGTAGSGGGGAGGLYYAGSQSLSTAKTVTIGAGGAGGLTGSRDGTNGTDSSFTGLTTAVGGGHGGGASGGGAATVGGSGGGGGANSTTGAAGTAGQGNAGGNGEGGANYGAGGGGGAGAVGANGSTTVPGNGGAGLNTYSAFASATGTGASGYYAGGGGGGINIGTASSGGAGGGGTGGTNTPLVASGAGTANTGGGGGGGGQNNGGSGGSGIVIIRYSAA